MYTYFKTYSYFWSQTFCNVQFGKKKIPKIAFRS